LRTVAVLLRSILSTVYPHGESVFTYSCGGGIDYAYARQPQAIAINLSILAQAFTALLQARSILSTVYPRGESVFTSSCGGGIDYAYARQPQAIAINLSILAQAFTALLKARLFLVAEHRHIADKLYVLSVATVPRSDSVFVYVCVCDSNTVYSLVWNETPPAFHS